MSVYVTKDHSGYLYITQSLKVVWVNQDGTLGRQLTKLRDESASSMVIFDCNGEEIGLFYGIKPYLIADPATRVIYETAQVWNRSYILGTDSLGRDILTRLMYGTRVSLLVAFIAVVVNMVIGIVFGGISGYLGGMVDTVMMRIVDIISTIPLTLYVILIMVLLGAGIQSIIIALGTTYWVDSVSDLYGGIFKLPWHWSAAAAREPRHDVQRCDAEFADLPVSAFHSGTCDLPDYVWL